VAAPLPLNPVAEGSISSCVTPLARLLHASAAAAAAASLDEAGERDKAAGRVRLGSAWSAGNF